MKRFALMIFCLLFHSAIFAFSMNGVMSDNRDGTFAVTLNSDTDNTFTGTATLGADGNVTLDVVDESGEHYLGVGILNKEGSYFLTLKSNTSGDVANGMVTLD